MIPLSISEFALPVPRRGSIEAQSGYGRSSQNGQEIHAQIQSERAKSDLHYQAEVPIRGEFEWQGYVFAVSGRMDGLILTKKIPRIEEIKASFTIRELEKKLQKDPDHPYCLQLKTYGYLYWKQHGTLPKLFFHLVSLRTRLAESLEIPLSIDEYEAWLGRRLEDLVTEIQRAERRTKRRRQAAKKFAFPFLERRPGQEELIQIIEKNLGKGERLLLQAPTGLGKTAGVLFPVLKETLQRGQRVIYVTPKNSQHSVAEDAVERFQEAGAPIRSLTITAKSKICFKNEALCSPDYCEYAKDYYTKVDQFGLKEILSKKKKLTKRVFRNLGEEYQVCPFELQVEGADEADVIVCDYNYVFGPRSAFTKMGATAIGHQGKPSLVIDEAHNLYARALGYYSPELSTWALERMRPFVRELPEKFRKEAEDLLNGCIGTIEACRPEETSGSVEIDPPHELFLEQDAQLRTFLSRYLEADIEIQPRDVVLRMCFYWSEFTSALDFIISPKRKEFFTTFRPDKRTGGTVRITCCDASEMLKECYGEYDEVIGFSATLKPFEYYAQLSGLDPKRILTKEFKSPFPRQNRKVLIIPQISTKYSEREKNFSKIAEAIFKITALKPGNYFAFFPSFEFMERVLGCFHAPEGFLVLKQAREMKTPGIQAVLDHLKEGTTPTIVFAVQGGVFSEGVDYPGKMIIGAFIIGPPLPPFELEREKMRAYYEEHYGSGFDYTYTFPAMAKAIQAAGRVVRSETDRGLIVLMDNRFISPSYFRSMPEDWYDSHPNELVSRSILKEVSAFWENLKTP